MSKAHAFLSASAAHRWIACPPSAKLQEKYEDKGSEYAAQGTDAHTLAEWKALKLIGVDRPDPRENLTWYDQEMEEATDAYAQYIAETIAEAKKTCSDPCVMIEQRVDFSRWVPDGFGTADAVVVGSGHLWITDLKYGTGVEVLAENNPQASCYALGCIELLDDLYGIDTVTMQIFQPRRSHVSEWTVSKDELLKWAEEVLQPAAKLAAAGKGKFCPGDHCRFCKARHECRARADAQLKLMRYDFELPPTLTDEEMIYLERRMYMMKKTRKNNLAEMQDQMLLKLEEYGFWVMFWALVLSIVIQLIIGSSIKEVLGEIIVLLIGSVYISVTTLKNGLWTRTSIPTRKGNALVSIIPAALISAIHIFKMTQSNRIETRSLLITAAIAVAVYVGCFVILEVLRLAYDKRRAALDDIDEKESEE